MLQKCRIVVSAWIIEGGGRDRGVSLLRRTVQKAISQSDGVIDIQRKVRRPAKRSRRFAGFQTLGSTRYIIGISA